MDVLNCTNIYTAPELNDMIKECEDGDEQAGLKIAKLLPEMEDVSVIDPLNEAFLNEHSVVTPHLLLKGQSSSSLEAPMNQSGSSGAVVRDVKVRFGNLDV